ncbi:MAG: hypothetical protein VB858_04420 [Planctomycetaceae bacterium]
MVTLPTVPPLLVWTWYKPVQTPSAIMLQIPPTGTPLPDGLTLRLMLQMLGIDPAAVSMCSLFGFWFSGDGGASPHFDQVVSGPVAGGDPNLVIHVDVVQVPGRAVAAAGPPQPMDEQTREIFKSFERDWKTTHNAERLLVGLHKQLNDMQIRLTTMNRDLTPEESHYADRSDHDDWRDARRWLRDASNRLSKCIKELVAGETTYVGKRKWFEQIYEEQVKPQIPFAGMEEARREFEYYRRTIQNLCDRMQAVSHHAQQEGAQRAQVVLSRIAVKVASKRAKGR